MQTFLQSAFLQALSHSLIASVWQMALMYGLAVACLRLFKLSSAQKFNVAFAAQLCGFILFVYTFIQVYNSHQYLSIAINGSNILSKINLVFIEYMPYVAVIYLCILLYKFSRFILTYHATKGLRKYELQKISPASRIFVQQMSQLFSLKRRVSIYLSSKINCPLTIGFFKPVILIPVAAINHLTTEQMEAVILHELAHIKRADYLLFILQSLIEKIFFFNIFSIMLGNIIERERENACDDWVLQFRYNSMHYAEALFKLGRLRSLQLMGMSFSGKKESFLLLRVKRLLHNTQSKNSFDASSVLIAGFSIFIMSFFILSTSINSKEKNASVSKPLNITSSVNIKPVAEAIPVSFKMTDVKRRQNKKLQKQENVAYAFNENNLEKEATFNDQFAAVQNALSAKQNYLIQVNQSLDSLKQIIPTYNQAVNSQLVVTPDVVQKALSYQNFKRLEDMLSVAGNSINITEADSTKNSYKKSITIEATDKNGNKHIYTVVVELYQ